MQKLIIKSMKIENFQIQMKPNLNVTKIVVLIAKTLVPDVILQTTVKLPRNSWKTPPTHYNRMALRYGIFTQGRLQKSLDEIIYPAQLCPAISVGKVKLRFQLKEVLCLYLTSSPLKI